MAKNIAIYSLQLANKHYFILFFLFFIKSVSIEGQTNKSNNLEIVFKIEEQIRWYQQELQSQRELQSSSKLDSKRQEYQNNIEGQEKHLAKLQRQFVEQLADVEIFDQTDKSTDKKDVVKDVYDLLSPLIESLKRASERPRKIEALKYELSIKEQVLNTRLKALEQMKLKINQEEYKPIFVTLTLITAQLTKETEEAQIQFDTISRSLKKEMDLSQPFMQRTSSIVEEFIKGKGINLLIVILVMFLTYWLLETLRPYIFKLPVFSKRLKVFEKSLKVLYGSLSGLSTIILGLTVLYLLNDWVLLTLAVIFLAGIIWSLKGIVPQMIYEGRTALNLGSIREGERIVFEGIAWKIEKIGFFSTLVNPALENGKLKIPIKLFVNSYSRRLQEDEPWFPSQKNDYVLIADNKPARVDFQSPEHVMLKVVNGGIINILTKDYLKAMYVNLSHGFHLEVMMPVNSEYQYDLVEKIIEPFSEHLKKLIAQSSYADSIAEIKVEFWKINLFYLEIRAFMKVDGQLAYAYLDLNQFVRQCFLEWSKKFLEKTVDIP